MALVRLCVADHKIIVHFRDDVYSLAIGTITNNPMSKWFASYLTQKVCLMSVQGFLFVVVEHRDYVTIVFAPQHQFWGCILPHAGSLLWGGEWVPGEPDPGSGGERALCGSLWHRGGCGWLQPGRGGGEAAQREGETLPPCGETWAWVGLYASVCFYALLHFFARGTYQYWAWFKDLSLLLLIQ